MLTLASPAPPRPLRTLLAGAMAIAAPLAPLLAQQADTTRLPSVVVTADRVARPIASTAASVTVLEGDALRAAGITHLVDALRTVPGISIARSGSLGAQSSLFLRGGESDYVRVLVDGVPMNDPGGAIDLGAITTDNLERVEIVRGPASVLYGSDAVTGVIQLFTRRATAPLDARLALRGGTYGTREVDASVGGRGGIGAFTLGLAHHGSDGMLAFNNAYRNDVVSLRGNASVGGISSVLALRHSDGTFEYPTDGAGHVVDRNAHRGERRLSSSLELSRPIGRTINAIVAFTALEVHGRTADPTDGPADTLGFYSYRSLGAVRRRGLDARIVARPLDAQTLSLGVEYGAEYQRSADSSNYDVSLNRFAASRITRAAYAQWVGDAGRLSYSLGGRYDDNDVYGVFRTARAAISARLWPGARLHGALGTGFKAPTFLESFNTAFSVGNAALSPERSRSWEAGVAQGWGDGRVEVAATFFDQRFRDLVQYTYVSPTSPNYFNIAAASARGLEVTARAQAVPGVALWGSATALRTRVDDAGFQSGSGDTFVQGQRLLRRPPLTVSAGTSIRRIARTALDLSVTRVSERDDRDFTGFPAVALTLPAYTRADVGGEFALGTGDGFWRATALTLRVENAFGARYEEIAKFAAPGRVVMVGARIGTGR